jgi:signal transduction histidine kinase
MKADQEVRPQGHPVSEKKAIADLFIALRPVVEKVARASTVRELAMASLEAIETVMDVEFTGFYFLNPQTKTLELLLAKGLSEPERLRAEATALERHPGQVIRDKKTFISNSEGHPDASWKSTYTDRLRIVSRVYCPIIHKDYCTGTLGLAASKEDAFDEAHVSIIEFIASVAAVTHAQIMNSNAAGEALSRMIHLVDSTHAGVLMEDENRTVLHTNPRFRTLFGIPEEAAPHLVGSDCEAGLHQFKVLFEDPEAFVGRVYELLRNQSKAVGDRLKLKDGRTLERDFIPVLAEGKFKGILWNYQDITRDLELKAQIEATERELAAERLRAIHSSKMASLGEMAGGIAHEINTPLAVISTLSGQLAEVAEEAIQNPATAEFSPELILGHSSTIESTSRRIAQIIRGMRVFARDGSKDPEVTFELKEVIDDTLSLCAESLKARQIQLTVDLEPGIRLHGRPVEISQVILNLISNSRDALASLDSRWIRIEGRRDPKQAGVLISITDSGKGIPEEIRGRLFEPFFTTKPVGQGTGLGLGISQKIIERHRGKMELDIHSPNTCFTITLPDPGF